MVSDRELDRPKAFRGARPWVWRWVGAGGAVALAASSWGSGSRPTLHTRILWPGLAPSVDTGGSPLLATVSVVAMAVLVVGWWRLREAQVPVRWWWMTATLWFVPLIASVPLYSRDLYSYAAQGALWGQGLSPYEHGVRDLTSDWAASTAPTWLDSPAPYGPVWLLIARGAAAVSGERLWLALLLLRLIAVVGVVVIAWAVDDIARRVGADARQAAWLAVAAPLLGAHFVSGGHNDAVMVAAVLAGVALALRGRFAWACLVVALGAMVKVTAVIVLPFIALLWAATLVEVIPEPQGPRDHLGPRVGSWAAWGRVGRAGALTLVAAGTPMVLVSVATGLGFAWLNPGATPGKNEQWTSLPTGLGMAVGAIGHLVGHPEWRDAAISAARMSALVVLALVLVVIWLGTAKPGHTHAPPDARHARDEPLARIVRGAGWAFLAVIVLAPAFLGWYYLWVLPLLAASLTWTASDDRVTTALALAAAILCFAQLPDGYSLGLTTTAIGVPIVVVATVLLVRAGARSLRRVDVRHLVDLSRPLLAPRPVHGGGSRIGDS